MKLIEQLMSVEESQQYKTDNFKIYNVENSDLVLVVGYETKAELIEKERGR